MELYRCYDENLTKYLQSQGLRYCLKAYDIVSYHKMWVFEKTDNLKQLIGKWEDMSPRG